MSHYIVGDIQGCFRELEALLTKVSFNPENDTLWCVGDIVARGPDSRDALRFFYQNSRSVHTVLGNHDLNLMAVLLGYRKPNPKDKLDTLLADSERFRWLDWLRQQPLLQLNTLTKSKMFLSALNLRASCANYLATLLKNGTQVCKNSTDTVL